MAANESEVERFEHGGNTVVIHRDLLAESPRTAMWRDGQLATLACWHRRANLGDRQIEGMGAKELIRDLRDKGERIVALLPLYLFEHSGMTMSAGASADAGNPFSCRWDSGQVGWAYVTRSAAEKAGCVGEYHVRGEGGAMTGEKRKYDRAFFEEAIRAEVIEYDAYLTGDVYGYDVLAGANDEDKDDNERESLDSCWGFYGLDYVREAAKEAAAAS